MNSQNIDLSTIKCDNCLNQSKANALNNEFFICLECNMNLCPFCKSTHDKTHSTINYDDKNYLCHEHGKNFFSYCKDCNMDICFSCSEEHKYHKGVTIEDYLINITHLRKKMNILENSVKKFKKNLEENILKMKKIIENIDIFYNINNELLNFYEKTHKINYILSLNLKVVDNAIDKEIDKIRFEYDYGNNLNKMLYLYSEMFDENIEIEIKYRPERKNKEMVRIFGKGFLENNIQKCKIIYKEKEYGLTGYLKDIDFFYNNKDEFTLKLKGINNITDISYLFERCQSLFYVPDLSKWNTSKITKMRESFCNCENLISLPDMSKWNISNVFDISRMFFGCKSLKSLPDISKWNTSNVTDMRFMFSDCSSLISLPDI